jgi:hypothetical protein
MGALAAFRPLAGVMGNGTQADCDLDPGVSKARPQRRRKDLAGAKKPSQPIELQGLSMEFGQFRWFLISN